MGRVVAVVGVAVAVILAACGSEQNAATDVDAGTGSDFDAGTGDAARCGDTQSDPNNCGTCGNRCGTGQFCVKGACACPLYQTFCDGKCIPTTDDAQNCGGCNKPCTGALACSAGTCSDTCLPGLEICANRCVDKQSDNAHCGTCGNACPAGQGCVAGACVTAVAVGPAPTKCAGGGPPIVNPTEQGGCLGNLAQTTFRWSLCSCKDVQFSGALLTDAYDSAQGPYTPGGMGGGVGSNEAHSASLDAEVGGDLWSHSASGLGTSAPHTIKHDLRLNGPLQTSSTVTVGHDAWINGNVTASQSVSIANVLTVPAGAVVAAQTTAKSTVNGPVTFPLPCDCAPNQLVPIAAIVEAHRSPNNDNALIGLDPAVLQAPTGPTRLDLPCGEYYLAGITGGSAVTIAAHGRTAVYVEGDVVMSGAITFVVDSTGELDIFISGKLSTSSELRVGSPNFPALSRTYVGSKEGLALAAQSRVAGNLYAAHGDVTWSNASDLYGALFAGNFTASGPTRIHYDRAVLRAGDACQQPSSGCGSCRDCNNQACINGQCGACGSSSDCCAPLVCENGTCVTAIK